MAAAAKKRVSKKPLVAGAPEAQPAAWLDDLCAWLAAGKTMRAFCREPKRPSDWTIYDKMRQDAEVASRVARARDVGYDVIAEECGAIADDGSNDWMETRNGPAVNGEHIQRSKLRIETRLKLLACWNPRKYGAKQEIEHKGAFTVTITKDDASVG